MYRLLFQLLFGLQRLYNRFLSLFINYHYSEKKHPSIPEEILNRYNLNRQKGAREVLCYAPFRHMYFGFNGDVRACCINNTDLYGNIAEMSPEQLWNSGSIRRLRENILDYNLSGGCAFCNRQLRSQNFHAFEGRIYDTVLPKRRQSHPVEMTFELFNTCNLECVMCSGTYSSSIRRNREKLPPLEPVYGPGFADSLKAWLPGLKVARFMGGEPFLIPEYFEIMEFLVEHNPSCTIYIQTNGSVLNQRVRNILEKANVRLSISIDSLQKANYESIRKNASFDKLMEHMDYFRKHKARYPHPLNINCCVMRNNWQDIPELVRYCNRERFSITLIPVDTPQQLSLRLMSEAELQVILDTYRNCEAELLEGNRFNGTKFSDLVRHTEYWLQKVISRKASMEKYLMQDLSVLHTRLFAYLQQEAGKEEIFGFISAETERQSKLLPEAARKVFLALLFADIQENYEGQISNYNSATGWKREFSNYLDLLREQAAAHTER